MFRLSAKEVKTPARCFPGDPSRRGGWAGGNGQQRGFVGVVLPVEGGAELGGGVEAAGAVFVERGVDDVTLDLGKLLGGRSRALGLAGGR